jgi:hypothetical protein
VTCCEVQATQCITTSVLLCRTFDWLCAYYLSLCSLLHLWHMMHLQQNASACKSSWRAAAG